MSAAATQAPVEPLQTLAAFLVFPWRFPPTSPSCDLESPTRFPDARSVSENAASAWWWPASFIPAIPWALSSACRMPAGPSA